MIYFDHASGALPDAGIADHFREMLLKYPYNQEALHAGAMAARRAQKEAESKLAALAGLPDYKVVWGSSAGELFRILAGHLSTLRRGGLLLTQLNHPALNIAMQAGSGLECEYLKTTRNGIAPETLASGLATHPLALALPQVNSELGLRFDTAAAVSVARANSPETLVISDAVQAFGKEPLHKADAVIVSGHKLGVPAAAAMLFDPARFPKLERFAADLRTKAHFTGRVEIPALLTLVFAAEKWLGQMASNIRHITELSSFLRRELTGFPTDDGKLTDLPIPEEYASPYIVPVIFKGMQSAILLRMLSQHGICVGSGAACAAESGDPSLALAALGYRGEDARAALRISFAPSNTLEEVETLLAALRRAVKEY